MSLPRFELERPETLTEALQTRDEDHVALGGGTELLLAMRMGLLRPEGVIDVKRVPELTRIERDGDLLIIGAACTHDQIATSPLVDEVLPELAAVASRVGNPRVRVQGTFGGNVFFAEPKSDVIAMLIAYDAKLELHSPRGIRRLAAQDFVLGAYWSDLQDDELLVRFHLPLVPSRRVVYRKFQTMERPTVGVALREDHDGSALLVLAAVCDEPVVISAPSVSELDPVAIAGEIDVIADLTGDEAYKRQLTVVTIRRTIEALASQEVRDAR